jgi:hypothetical protein
LRTKVNQMIAEKPRNDARGNAEGIRLSVDAWQQQVTRPRGCRLLASTHQARKVDRHVSLDPTTFRLEMTGSMTCSQEFILANL